MTQFEIASLDDIHPEHYLSPYVGTEPSFDLESLPTRAPDALNRHDARDALAPITDRLRELQIRCFAENRQRVLVVLQATDTGGKDSTIRSIFGPLNPQGVDVVGFGVPSEDELAHDYLWRVHQHVPANGQITVFNRSHYEDVLVVRVHDLVSRDVWQRRYAHIREFEQMLADEGTTIVKIFLNLSKDEQRERLQERLDRPDKHWKFNPADLEERKKWGDYREAFAAMLAETSTPTAPWYVVPADQKWYRNIVIGRIMVETLEALDMRFPPAHPDMANVSLDD